MKIFNLIWKESVNFTEVYCCLGTCLTEGISENIGVTIVSDLPVFEL